MRPLGGFLIALAAVGAAVGGGIALAEFQERNSDEPQPTDNQAVGCPSIPNDLARLACFDRLFPPAETRPAASQVTQACEEALKRRLKSPSSYVRVELRENSLPIDIDKWNDSKLIFIRDNFDADNAVKQRAILAAQIEKMKAGKQRPVRFLRTVTYDAANPMGVMLRGHFTCTFESADGTESDAKPLTVNLITLD